MVWNTVPLRGGQTLNRGFRSCVGNFFYRDMKTIKSRVQNRDAHSSTIHTPHSCFALECQITHQSYSLHASVSKLTLRSHKAVQAQLFTVFCIFRYDGSILRSDTCALPLQQDQSWLVRERCRDAGGYAINVGDIFGTDRKQCVGIGCGCWIALNRGI